MAGAFRNLRIDPANSPKFGIKWRDAFYVDIGIVFGWMHGSLSFQISLDTIAYIMGKEGIK